MNSIVPKRRTLYILWSLSWFLLIVLVVQPVSYGLMRLTILLCLGCLWLGALILFQKQRVVHWGLILTAAIVSLFLVAPGRPFAVNTLRSAYVDSLQTYIGVPYVWGGENKVGIDCSGLVRQGLIQANLSQGLLQLNPALVRKALELWWYDAGADALRDGYRGFTLRLWPADSINAIDLAKLLPGDLAVTMDGEHILAYGGKGTWIEADPTYHKVLAIQVPEPNNIWFNMPVYGLRWKQLSNID